MPDDRITYAFVAGEVAPAFRSRGDLSKYSLGLGLAKNVYVDFRGGLSNCPGSAYVGPVPEAGSATRLQTFRANGNDYQLVFSEQKMRVIRNGGYVLEPSVTVTNVTRAGTARVTAAGHGFSDGDLITFPTAEGMTDLVGRYFTVGNVATDAFSLYGQSGAGVNATEYDAFVSGEAARVYSIPTPYTGDQPKELDFSQNKLEMQIVHVDQRRHLLTYVSDTEWTLIPVEVSASGSPPANPSITPSTTGLAGYAIVVTAVLPNGEETLPSEHAVVTNSINFTTGPGSATYSWDPVPGAVEYNVYRTLVLPTGGTLTLAQELGFIGRTLSPPFVDANITPDFTKTPPQYRDPFAESGIDYIEVTNGGTGHTISTTVTVTDPTGTGFAGYPVVQGGAVVGVVVTQSGSGYTAPVVSFSPGSGATATVALTPASGQNPGVTERFQQRQAFGGTINQPLAVEGSKVKLPNNFDVSPIVNDADAYSFTLDSPDVTPIRHLLALRNTLLAFTRSVIYGIRGGEGVTITPLNAQADIQSYRGASTVRPLPIDLNVIYTIEQGTAVYAMTFTYYTESFQQQDISVLSSHLLGKGKEPTRLEFLDEPNKLLYVNRADGKRLICTYVPEQEVTAWTQQETRGLYKDCSVCLEDGQSTLYQVVDRLIEGTWVRLIERQDSRTFAHPEDSWFVDCGLRLPQTTPEVGLTFSASEGSAVTATTTGATDAAVGDVIYAGGGKFLITAVNSTTEYVGDWRRKMTQVIPQTDPPVPLPLVAGEWELATPVTTVGGLWHLEGEEVVALADGDVITGLTVTAGSVTLEVPATKVVVGIPYTSRIETLPPTSQQQILEGSRKSIYGASVRFNETRGLFMGAVDGELQEVPPLLPEFWGDEVVEDTGTLIFNTSDNFDYDAVVALEQRYPLPWNVLGLVLNVEKGDD